MWDGREEFYIVECTVLQVFLGRAYDR